MTTEFTSHHKNPKKLLALASFPYSAAASRFRICLYESFLQQQNISLDFKPFLNETEFASFYRPGAFSSKALAVAKLSIKHLSVLLSAKKYHGVFVQREAALLGPAIVELCLNMGFQIPLIFDFDDAIWLDSTNASQHKLAAKLLKVPQKTQWLVKRANLVVAGSNHLANYAKQYNHNVHVFPSVISHTLWAPLPHRLDGIFTNPNSPPVIGWIGTHSTAPQLELVAPALRRLSQEGHQFTIRVVGAASSFHLEGLPIETAPWNAQTEISDFQNIDIGLAPMWSSPWSEGKCAFKQIQYMAVGVPHVSSLIGGARDFVVHNENALVAHNEGDWYIHLKQLLTDQALRAKLATNGRKLIEEKLSLEKQGPILTNLIQQVLLLFYAKEAPIIVLTQCIQLFP